MNVFLKVIAVWLMVTASLDASKAKPNVLLIYADDLGYGDLSCQNPSSKVPTLHLDRLAKEGMTFSDAHSSSGICTPSRYSLLTGRYHWRKFHNIVWAMGESVFSPDRLTLPKMMKMKGYSTSAIGKWHLGWNWQSVFKENHKIIEKGPNLICQPSDIDWTKPIPQGPCDQGFDTYFGDTVINFPPYTWFRNDKVEKVPDVMMDTKRWKEIKEGGWECREGPATSDWDPYQNIPQATAEAVKVIHGHKGKNEPFFMYFAFPSPHAPIIPNDRFDGASKAGPYGDFVVETDDAVGQLLKALKESGQNKNTIVIFSADNGPEHYAYQRDQKYGHWSSAPFRGLKRDIYEGGHHVPMIIKWPGLTRPGSVSKSLVSQIDIMATLADHLNVDLPVDAAEDSVSLLPVLKDSKREVRDMHIHNTFEKRWAMRKGDWVLIEGKNGYHTGVRANWEVRHGYVKDDKGKYELYNMAKDPSQKHNLASSYPEVVKELGEEMNAFVDRHHFNR
jgi:arylsulfatase A